MSATSTPYHSKAWLLDGPIDSLPGLLSFDGSTLRYVAINAGTFPTGKLVNLFTQHGQSPPADAATGFPAVLFNVPRTAVRSCRIPWYYFHGGAVIDIRGHALRFSFIRPQNTVAPSYYSENLLQMVGGEGQEEVDVPEGKIAGRRWRDLLTS